MRYGTEGFGRKTLQREKSYDEIVEKLISELERIGFVEQQDEVEKTWKVLASFHYIEELIDCISITDDTDEKKKVR